MTDTPKSKQKLSESASWVDVRDLALAHVLALEKPEAGGERIIISSGSWRWQDWGKSHLIHAAAVECIWLLVC